MAHVMTESMRSDAAMLLWAGGTTADESAFSVPIDSTVRRVTFSATFDGTGGTAAIAMPDGSQVQPRAGVEDTVMNCGRALSVDAPPAGFEWRVTLQPTNRFWLVVYGRTNVDLLSADFVRPGGRPGHEGLFEINGQPIAGRPATLRVRLSAPDGNAPEFRLISVRVSESAASISAGWTLTNSSAPSTCHPCRFGSLSRARRGRCSVFTLDSSALSSPR